MVDFLVKRPIAVFMVSLAFLILGAVALTKTPTDLMPDIPIPEITVRYDYQNTDARELETVITRPLRQHLLQVSNLRDIRSESRNGVGVIRLYFDYGTESEYSFIETNEVLDEALRNLPRDFERPRVIQASSTDIPVLKIAITEKEPASSGSFLELSQFVEASLKQRIEQLPDVAMVDVSGLEQPEVWVQPKRGVLNALGVGHEQLIAAIQNNNLSEGYFTVQDGIYQYSFRFSDPMITIEDIENTYINLNNQLIQLKELAFFSVRTQEKRGEVIHDESPAILISVIKQSEARMDALGESLQDLLWEFQTDYPNLSFTSFDNQSYFINESIDTLVSSLILGTVLAVVLLFFFFKDFHLPILIGLSVPVALLVSFLFLYLVGISINIISLSGLILAVGLMIDNAIIVIDNISQKKLEGYTPIKASVMGATEMITPLLTSVLTTCMIFLPLLFLSGMTGALFFDQAITVSIGLLASWIVSITLIPVVYFQLKQKGNKASFRFLKNFPTIKLNNLYNRGFSFFFYRPFVTFSICLLSLLLGVGIWLILPSQSLPDFTQSSTVLELDWNEPIGIEENSNRIKKLVRKIGVNHQYITEIAEQQYLLNNENRNFSEAKMFIETPSPAELNEVKKKIIAELETFPSARFSFYPPQNAFDKVFGSREPPLVVQVFSKETEEVPSINDLPQIEKRMPSGYIPLATEKGFYLALDREQLLLYGIEPREIQEELELAFSQNLVGNLETPHGHLPIALNYEKEDFESTIRQMNVRNGEGELIPLQDLVIVFEQPQYVSLEADRSGEFLGFVYSDINRDLEQVREQSLVTFSSDPSWGVRFSGSYLDIDEMTSELIWVMVLALFLLYFIMAAQFESLLQPLIILSEIPISAGISFLLLWLFGQTMNVMAAIGFVVMSGIIINDSIIKIHTINMLRKDGVPLVEAIHRGGEIRLNSIIITTLTTVLSLLPFLFFTGFSAELQLPLALVVIGGLIFGTWVSLYVIPLIYYRIYRT